MILAAYLFAVGSITSGLIAAWLMTFLDTVDGKLARVTVRSSRIGDKLDHWTDVAHPPVWWTCLPLGIASREENATIVFEATVLILACYFLSRVVETTFKKRLGFNQFIWRPFDALFLSSGN
jgi:phosphatidylglycerophosphate synthase